MIYGILFIVTALISWACTTIVRWYASAVGVVDQPGPSRKIHTTPIPLLGGLAIFSAMIVVGALYYFFAPADWPSLVDAHVNTKHLLGIAVALGILCIGGALDDTYAFSPIKLIVAPFCAVLALIAFGIGVHSVSSPLTGAPIPLNQWNILLFWYQGLPRYLTLPSDIVTFVWLFGTMYTTKLLDGMDGLVSGITVIGASVIGIVSLFFFVNEPTAILSFLTAGAFAGFLVLNYHPAKIFLGEAGSTIAGFLLGTLALISGAKFAIAMLVLGIPILDTVWVIVRRIVIERRSPFVGDRKHLHFRMLDVGFSQRQVVGILWSVSALFGVAALFMQTRQKMIALILVGCVMIGLVGLIHCKRAKGERGNTQPSGQRE